MHNLLNLLQLTDPMLPIGGYAHSYGLETYVQQGVVHNAATAKLFIKAMLQQNVHFTDAAFASLAYDAAHQTNWDEIVALSEECTAVKLPAEIRAASHKLGARLVKIFQTFSNTHAAKWYSAVTQKEVKPHYCIAFGIYAQVLGIDKCEALQGFYYNAAVGMVTNCVKLVPLGQQDGQVLLFSLQPLLYQLATQSVQPNRALLGKCCTGFDVRSMQHERLYSRLYMS